MYEVTSIPVDSFGNQIADDLKGDFNDVRDRCHFGNGCGDLCETLT